MSYEVLVKVMDAVRLYELPEDRPSAGEGIERIERAELFPEISIGDAPRAGQAG